MSRCFWDPCYLTEDPEDYEVREEVDECIINYIESLSNRSSDRRAKADP